MTPITRRSSRNQRARLAAAIEPLEMRMLLTSVIVNTVADSTDAPGSSIVSLRDAINIANKSATATTITFSPTVFATAKTITLGSSSLELSGAKPVTITGSAAGVTIKSNIVNNTDPFGQNFPTGGTLTVDSGVTASFSKIALSQMGFVNSGSLTLVDSTISGNKNSGFGIGLNNSGVATIVNSTFSGNTDYGNPYGFVQGIGGAIDNTGKLTITNSTLSGNSSIDAGGGLYNSGTATVNDCTITANSAGEGGGIGNAPAGTLTVANSIVADNTAGAVMGPDVEGKITSLGHNLVGKTDGSTGWIASDLKGTAAHPLDPKLSPLDNYGGLTSTQFPLAGSPAIGAGSVALIPSGITTDQRGFARTIGGKVDIGADELQKVSVVTLTAPAAQHVVAGVAASINLGSFTDPGGKTPFTVDVNWGDGAPVSIFSNNSAGTLGAHTHTFIDTGSLHGTIVVFDASGDVSQVAALSISSATAPPRTLVVNTTSDQIDPTTSKTLSLRDAVNRADAAFGPVMITFDPAVFATAHTITLSQTLGQTLELGGNRFGAITLVGPLAGVTVVGAIAVDAKITASLDRFTIQKGGIVNDGNLTVSDSVISGAATHEGGIFNLGTMTLAGSTVTGNTAVLLVVIGGYPGTGGGIDNSGSMTVSGSTISGNIADDGIGGGIFNSGKLNVIASTISGNQANSGGGIENVGTLTLTDSTVANNSGADGTAGIEVAVFGNTAVTTIYDSTISGNTSSGGGGYGAGGISADSVGGQIVTLANTIISGNTSTSGMPDVTGAFNSLGHNLIGQTDTSTGWIASDLTGSIAHPLNAKLSPLGNYGGPTQTMVPLAGSPAIGAGSVALIPSGVTTDQRGFARTVNGKVDIGAVELQIAPLKTIVVNTKSDVTDPAGSKTVSLRDAINQADAAMGPVNITFDPKVFATAQTIQLTEEITALQDNTFGVIDFIGPAAGITVKSHITFPGTNSHGEPIPAGNTLVVDAGVTASFSNFTLSQLGFVNSGTLTLLDSTITGNMVVGNGAGLDNQGTATVLRSTISNNYADADQAPGAIVGGYGGGIENDGTLTITNSTISGNTSFKRGGGIDNDGVATISDSTISANTSRYNYLPEDGGGGIHNDAPSGSSHPKVTLANTIVAGNTDANGRSDVQGAFTSSGHNLIGATDGSTGFTSSDLTGTIAHPLNANLSPLGNFGGLTQVMVPLAGCPALHAGSVSLIPSGVTTDQRGLPRVIGGKVDIGAVEINQAGPFTGAPAPFGTIQAENFDLGGQNVGYFNPTNTNRGGLYRPLEGVGIGAIPSADGGGFFVGWTTPGEYLNYTVSVADTATYTLNFRVASQPKGGTFHLDVDGKDVTDELSVPSTGDWNVYKTISDAGITLTAGTHVLRLVMDSHGTGTGAVGNFDSIQAVKTGPPNLLVNGNFAQGATGFTSQYPHSGTAGGGYLVASNPATVFDGSWLPIGDHTTGTGLMLLADASTTANTFVWQETVNVATGTNYSFAGWAADMHMLDTNVPDLAVYINNVKVGATFAVPSNPGGVWSAFGAAWNSGASKTATIKIVDLDTQFDGNDFALDDLSFAL